MMMARHEIIKPRPRSRSTLALQLLKYDVDDDRFLRIFGDIARLIRRSNTACEKATEYSNPDYKEFIVEAECDYLEELIGASFIVLQTKIRRVTSCALAFQRAMQAERQINIHELSSEQRVRELGGRYKDTKASFVQLIWDVGNYYKHRDEWPVEVWREKRAGEKENGTLKQSRRTRRSVESVGIHAATGHMRTAYEFFGIDPYWKCEQLAEKVQEWAVEVYKMGQTRLKT